MSKTTGYTYSIATRNPPACFVFCKWFTTEALAIEFGMQEIRDRSQYDVDYILIREGVDNKDDPIIWDSRRFNLVVDVKPTAIPFLIGQRVIIDRSEIATIIEHPSNARPIERSTSVWVRKQDGVEQWRALSNVQPLPNGQL